MSLLFKEFMDDAITVSISSEFQRLTTRSEKKCCPITVANLCECWQGYIVIQLKHIRSRLPWVCISKHALGTFAFSKINLIASVLRICLLFLCSDSPTDDWYTKLPVNPRVFQVWTLVLGLLKQHCFIIIKYNNLLVHCWLWLLWNAMKFVLVLDTVYWIWSRRSKRSPYSIKRLIL